MSLYEKESAIHRFEVNIKLLNEDLDFLPGALSSFSEFGEYFWELRAKEEYKKIDEILNSLSNPIKGKLMHKFYLRDLNKYAGKLVAAAKIKLEEIKRYEKPTKVKKDTTKEKIIAVKVPPSPWYKVKEELNELSKNMWHDRTIIRKIIPQLENLITDLQELGAPEKFWKKLHEHLDLLESVEDGDLTILQLRETSPSYRIRDKKFKSLIDRIENYVKRQIKKNEERY
ncbi:MAG: hypothetical protein NZ942_01370 [Candidatus Aenigmarchaeota archaeon]|nr:hypothetical protein [Candidatus Aenigmarchaeota archaeon]